MAIAQKPEELYGIRQFILELSGKQEGGTLLRKALLLSLAVHIFCIIFYVFFYSYTQRQMEELKLKIGDEQQLSRNAPHKPSMVAVGIVKTAPKKPVEVARPAPVPEAPVPTPAAPAPVQKKPTPPQPEAPKIVMPKPEIPLPIVPPAPPRSILPPLPELPPMPEEAAPMPLPTIIPAPEQQTGSGTPAAGYEHGTDTLAEQEAPENYDDILGAWLYKHYVKPKINSQNSSLWKAALRLYIDKDGTIRYFSFIDHSGNPDLDIALQDMVQRANPAPALPDEETRTFFDVYFDIILDSVNGSTGASESVPPLPLE